MKKGTVLPNIQVEKLIFGGKGLATSESGRRLIITGGAIPQSVVDLRVTKKRKNYLECQIVNVVKKSPLEQPLPDHYQVYGGCKWLPIPYETQTQIKQEQVQEAFNPIKDKITGATFHPIVTMDNPEGYRNKVEFSFGKYISKKEEMHDEFRFGFHKQGSFDRIINCTYCVLADETTNNIFKKVDELSRASGVPTYDPKTQVGFWRHLVIRKSEAKNEYMVTLSVNSDFSSEAITTCKEVLQKLTKEFSQISSAYLLHNTGKADIVQGEYELIHGDTYITETLLGKNFQIQPRSFFQTNSKGAEKLYTTVRNLIENTGGTFLDLYAGTGTIGIILSDLAKEVYSIELVESASQDNKKNADLNNIANITVVNKKVEDFAETFLQEGNTADTIVVDPPRAGMHPSAPDNIKQFGAKEIIYVSCNPATLVRDLESFLDMYTITDIIPVDMFPHTHHIETVVKMRKVV